MSRVRAPWPLRRIGLFLLLFALLQGGWQAAQGSALERLLIEQLTAGNAARLINLLTPPVAAHAEGARIVAAGGGVNILNGCEGAEVLFLMLAAFAVTPLSAAARLLAMLSGTLLVFALNQLRIVVLFYARRSDPGLFADLHGIVLPLLMVLAVAAFHAWWVQRPQALPESMRHT
ncbi:MAG: exosortase/archaeosortase family protein [Pseudomonadota bacterium]|nr:exosortase/archaeosortase family protein [Pseudomonadota bacterium]